MKYGSIKDKTIKHYGAILVLNYCINELSKKTNKKILDGLGELLDTKQKKFVKNQLLDDTIKLFKLYREFPIIKK